MFRKLAGLTAIAGLFVASSAFADISVSVHNFSATFGGGEICVVCHAPHNNQNAADNLLWNHDPSTNVGSFVPYTNPDTLDGTAGQPGPISLLCLGCHDGSVAADAYGGAAGTAGNTIDGINFGGLQAFGVALSNDHPIGITYEPSADTELAALGDAATFFVGPAGTVDDLVFGPVGTETQTVECGSCHDVHNTRSNGNTTLLVVDNANSGLCLTCHNK